MSFHGANLKIKEIEIKGFFAKDNVYLCNLFTEGHTSVLKQHGFLHFKTHDTYWHSLHNCYVIIALHNGEPIGGIRLEQKTNSGLLPYEKVLLNLDPNIKHLSQKLRLENLAEPCSLWNSRIVSGKNLSIYLSRVSISMSTLLNIKSIISFNATYTFRVPLDVGCKLISCVGNKGYFNYPTSQFKAALWVHTDLKKLNTANHTSRERMKSLRVCRKQIFLERYDNISLLINYDLEV